MKKLLLFAIVFCSTFGFSQENWDYLPIEITNNYHGAICPIDENTVHVVSDYGKFYKTTDGGESWTQFDSGVNEFFFDLTFDNPNNGYAVGDNGKILKTSNAGQTWSELSSGTTEALVSVDINAVNSIWSVGDNGTVLHSTNGGNSWVLNSSLTAENLNDIKFKDENIGYIAGSNGILFFTENGGTDWIQIAIPTSDDLSSISITDSNVYLLSGNNGVGWDEYTFEGNQVYKTNDNENWEQFYIEDFLTGATAMQFLTDDIGYMITSNALLCDCCYVLIDKTIDGGTTWTESLNEETNAANCHANVGYADIVFPTGEIGYALLGRFILKTPYETASIEDFNKNNSFTIYPNPTISGSFNLNFNISEIDGISIEVVDVNGRKLYAQTDLKKDNNISIPALSEGIYFVKVLKNGKMVTAKKLLKQ